jgi:hypothetical protein
MNRRRIIENTVGIFLLVLVPKMEISHLVSGLLSPTLPHANETISENIWSTNLTQGMKGIQFAL